MEIITVHPYRQAINTPKLDAKSVVVVDTIGVSQDTTIAQTFQNDRRDGYNKDAKPTIVVDAVETPQESGFVENFLDAKTTISISSEDASNDSTILRQAFLDGRKNWTVEPVMAAWKPAIDRTGDVLAHVEALHESWSSNKPGAFSPSSDPLWTSTVTEMRKAGLPLHNNNINMPEDIDEGWPFHFKEAERLAVVRKGVRVGDSDPAGYVCHWNEANHYCIRALQQELRRKFPNKKPLLVACKFDIAVLQHVSRLLGLEFETLKPDWTQVGLQNRYSRLRLDGRPLIFAATMCNNQGECDDFKAIRRLAKVRPVWVHVDASRNFDYITTLSPWSRARLKIPRLTLAHSKLGSGSADQICASTIVAGGMSGFVPSPVVALKPRVLGNLVDRRIQYIDANDSTVSGSRDSLGPLLLGMQEQRFSKASLQKIYRRCFKNRERVAQMLAKDGATVKCPPMSLDLIIHSPRTVSDKIKNQLGMVCLGPGTFLATMQPSVRTHEVHLLLNSFSICSCNVSSTSQILTTNISEFPIPQALTLQLGKKISLWRERVRDSAGYPFNQGSYTALGPVIGHFLDKDIPIDWLNHQADAILTQRKRSFGVSESDLSTFGAAFTTGSTMGNQIGVHAAVESFPDNFIYVSSAAHYSVTKALMDSDVLTGRWEPTPNPHFAVISANEAGQMDCDALVREVLQDRQACRDRGQKYGVTLFLTLGTTFVGANDDILGAQRALQRIGQEVSYIHVDGALDFGFSNSGILLDHPSSLSQHLDNGVAAAQGITLSHHKAYGMMVSGEVLCFDPSQQYIPSTCSALDPRAVFEVWFFQQMYTVENLKLLKEYSLQTAAHLHTKLKEQGVHTKLNDRSSIVVVERPPSWIVEDFGLRCEGNWAHYITMPHINCAATERFVRAMASLDSHLSIAFHQVRKDLERVFGQGARCSRVRPQDPRFQDILTFAADKATKSYPKDILCSTNIFKVQEHYIRTGVCVVVHDYNDNPAALLLVRKLGQRKYATGPILIKSSIEHVKKDVTKLASLLLGQFFGLLQIKLDR